MGAGELGLEGWAVYVDANNNQAQDAGEPATLTDTDGVYLLSGLADGTHAVIVDSPAGWEAVSPIGFEQAVTLAGADEAGVDFAVLPDVGIAADASLVGHWQFDEGSGSVANDSSMSQSHAVLADTMWMDDIERGSVLAFDGVTSYAEAGFVIDPGATDFTASAWVRLDRLPDAVSNASVHLSQQDGTGMGRTWLRVSSDGSLRSNLGSVNTVGNTVVQSNIWHHVAVTYEGNRLRLYLDGREVADEQRDVEAADGNMIFGAHKGTAQSFLDGVIHDARIYDRALSRLEI